MVSSNHSDHKLLNHDRGYPIMILDISVRFWRMLSILRHKFKNESFKDTVLEGIFRLNAN
jgi:hypothetical protein